MNILDQILEEIEAWAYKPDVGRKQAEGLVKAIKIIRSHMEDGGWIPVASKNFPTSLEDKLLQTDSGDMYVGRYNENLEEFETGDFMFGADYGKVVAWKELPEPYRPKED